MVNIEIPIIQHNWLLNDFAKILDLLNLERKTKLNLNMN